MHSRLIYFHFIQGIHMQIGISLMEYISFAALVFGILWLAAQFQRRRILKTGKKPWWITFGADFFGVIAFMLFCRVAIADWQEVPTGSMEPTLRVGDRILVNKLAYGPRLPFTNTAIKLGEPQRGDVVVFRFPGNVSILYVKRLIGLPNDVVTYSRGLVSVNHQAFQVKADESIMPKKEDTGQAFMDETTGGSKRVVKLNNYMPGAGIYPEAWLNTYKENCVVASTQEWQCKVPAGKYLMMGDNRDHSSDSRVWGFLDEREVYGKAVKVIVNFSDLTRFWTAL
jgi:signal peptidase I